MSAVTPRGKSQIQEDVTLMVNNFLIKRKYTESETSVPALKDINAEKIEDMALSSSICNEMGLTNVFSFAANSSNPSFYDEQYSNLKSFITGANQVYRLELSNVLFPMFANIYLELVAKSFSTAAGNFFSKHSSEFMTDHNEEIQHLQGVTGAERVNSSDVASTFRRSKYVVKMSKKVFSYFVQYLRSGNHALLLHLLNKNFCIEISHSKPGQRQNTEEEDVNSSAGINSATPAHKASGSRHSSSENDEESLVSLKKSIGQIRNGPACLPSLAFYTFTNSYKGLSSAAISKDGSFLCGGFEDSSVRIWSLNPKKLFKSKLKTGVSTLNLASDLCSAHHAMESVASDSLTLRGHSGPVYRTCFSPDSSLLLSASEDTSVRLWSMHSYTNMVLYKGHSYPVWGLDISPQCLYFASCSQDCTVRLWSFEYTYPVRIFAGHLQDVDCVTFHPNSSYLASGSADKTCRLWDLQSGNCVRLFTGHKGSVLAVSVSPDGLYLVSAGEDRSIRVWDLSAGTLLKELHGHTDTVYSLAFSSNGTLLVSGGLDNSVRVWDFGQTLKSSNNSSSPGVGVSPEHMASFPTNDASVYSVQFNTCNLVLAAGTVTP